MGIDTSSQGDLRLADADDTRLVYFALIEYTRFKQPLQIIVYSICRIRTWIRVGSSETIRSVHETSFDVDSLVLSS